MIARYTYFHIFLCLLSYCATPGFASFQEQHMFLIPCWLPVLHLGWSTDCGPT